MVVVNLTRQYLCAIDPQFDAEIKEVEQNMHREVHITDPHVQARSFQLASWDSALRFVSPGREFSGGLQKKSFELLEFWTA